MFDIKDKKLYYHIYDETNILVKESKDTFNIMVAPQVKFVFSIKGKDTLADIVTTNRTYNLKKYVRDTTQSDAVLKPYTGVYYCPELDCKYGIVLNEHHLELTNNKYNNVKITLVNKDHLINDYWWINHFVMTRDSKGNITGFEINSDRTMHLRFNKIE